MAASIAVYSALSAPLMTDAVQSLHPCLKTWGYANLTTCTVFGDPHLDPFMPDACKPHMAEVRKRIGAFYGAPR